MAKTTAAEIDKPFQPDKPGLGECLRAIRQSRKLTLSAVSALTGLATSTLSKVENNQMSLTYDKLLQLARGLDIELTELFGGAGSAPPLRGIGRRTIGGPGDGRHIRTGSFGYAYICTELIGKEMVPMICDVLADSIAAFGELSRHSGEEFTFVLEGEVFMHTDFYEPCLLGPGAWVYFDATMGHAYVRASQAPARILSVCSASERTMLSLALDQTAPPTSKRLTRKFRSVS